MRCRQVIGALCLSWLFVAPPPLLAQTGEFQIPLTVDAGRPLEVVIEQRTTIKKVGQPVAGTLVEPLYAYDRVVVPAGTRVLGHVAALEDPSKVARTRAILSGDLTPLRHIVLQFDTLVFDDGRRVGMIQDNNPGAVTAGGFFGLGILGIPLSHLASPIGLTLSIMGASRSVYRNVVAKGREVQFPADTVMQLQLAPGPSAAQR
jgi:hypothetical protein